MRDIFWVGDAGRAISYIINAEEEIVRNKIYNCGNNSENYQIKQHESVIDSKSDIDLNSGKQIVIGGSVLKSKGSINLSAAEDVLITSVEEMSRSRKLEEKMGFSGIK